MPESLKLTIEFMENGIKLDIPSGLAPMQLAFAAYLLTRQSDKLMDIAEFQESQMQSTIERVAAMPDLKKIGHV